MNLQEKKLLVSSLELLKNCKVIMSRQTGILISPSDYICS